MKKAFAITGLTFVFVALLFAAANYIYFSQQSKQEAINFAFISDAVNSISTDFSSMMIGPDSSVVNIYLYGQGCNDVSHQQLKQQVEYSVGALNSKLAGTGIEIVLDDTPNAYSVNSQNCEGGTCGFIGSISSLGYTIRTPNYERRNTFSGTTGKLCTGRIRQ